MRILLLGKDGQVGWELQRSLTTLGEVAAFGRESADLENTDAIREVVRNSAPSVIVNAAAYTAVDRAESEADRARRVNGDAVALLADEAARLGAWLVHYSTDYVFDGAKTAPYTEADTPRPLSVYGATKLAGERSICARHERHFILRTSWVYGARGNNFAKTMLRLAKERDELKIVSDQKGAPTSAAFIADVTALMLYRIAHTPDRIAPGLYHLAADGETTWYDYARCIVTLALEKGCKLKVAPDRMHAIPTEAYPLPAARPKNSRLDTTKLRANFDIRPPHWQHHVRRLMDELNHQGML